MLPLLGLDGEYAIYTKRILPTGTPVTNSLPKRRVFHLPDAAGKKLLEQELVAHLVEDRFSEDQVNSNIADTLDRLADGIDRKTETISGGLILMGGAVSLINPLAGFGMIAKSLLPMVGGKASTAGLDFVGSKFRNLNKSTALSKLKREASKEVKHLKPEIYTNSIIRSLNVIFDDPKTDYDPSLDSANWPDHFEKPYYFEITKEAIQEVYQLFLASPKKTGLQKMHSQWLGSFRDA